MHSRRTKAFRECFARLPEEIQRIAREKYRIFRDNPRHPSFQVKPVRGVKARDGGPLWEYRINRSYRAVCFVDGQTYVWVFVGSHDEFEGFRR